MNDKILEELREVRGEVREIRSDLREVLKFQRGWRGRIAKEVGLVAIAVVTLATQRCDGVAPQAAPSAALGGAASHR